MTVLKTHLQFNHQTYCAKNSQQNNNNSSIHKASMQSEGCLTHGPGSEKHFLQGLSHISKDSSQ